MSSRPDDDGDQPRSRRRQGVGRPRNLDEHTERELLVDAGYNSLRERGGDLSVADVLSKAGLSTRSFYRHFESKDALICAMYRRDSEWAADRLDKRLADCENPVEAVEAWIDEIFSFTRSPRRAERVSVLGSSEVQRATGIAPEIADARRRLVIPLAAAIDAGIHEGVFSPQDAEASARLVAATAMAGAGLGDPSGGDRPADQASVIAFVRRALGHP